MRRWDRRRVAVVAIATVVALALAVALAGAARGVALYGYVLVLAALMAAELGSRLGRGWQRTPRFERLLPFRPGPASGVLQLQGLGNRLAGGDPNEFDVHHRLRPLVQEIVAARLATGHGLDLETNPRRARELVGPRTWELVRPDREPPRDRWERNWPAQELDALIDELEAI